MLLGIDVGGTHTDAVAVDRGGVAASCKVKTDRDDLLASLRQALETILSEVDPAEVERLNLSTTLTTNAIVQGEIENVGVLVSSGPGIDPSDFIPCKDYHVIPGAVDHRGVETAALDREALDRAVASCAESGVRVFAAASKFSTRNPAHERAMADAAGAATQGGTDFVCLGHEMAGRLGFPRRIATAYFNAAVWRTFNGFADAVENVLSGLGLSCQVNILKADGGTMPLNATRKGPVQSIFSGPAASVMGIIGLCDIFHDSVIFDIGGTTTDIAVFAGGAPLIENEGINIGSHPTLVQALKVRSIGIGGDSAISVIGENVRVGPNRLGPSAAEGGDRPTLTDALNYQGLSSYGDAGRSRQILADFAASHSVNPEVLAESAVKYAAAKIHEETREFVDQINERPVYTIHELLEGRRVVPKKVYLMGGPAMAMQDPLFERFKLSIEVPSNFAVANAVGAALTRATKDVILFADTERGVLFIPSLGVEERITKSYTLENAEQEAASRLRASLEEMGVAPARDNIQVAASSSFNMVNGMTTVGRNIRVRCRVKPGVDFCLKNL